MAEKEFSHAERPSADPTSPALKEPEVKRPSFQNVLPKIWGENAVAFCDWCDANGKSAETDAVVTGVLKKWETWRLETFVELTECPSNANEYPAFYQSFLSEFKDTATDIDKQQTAEVKQQVAKENIEKTTRLRELATKIQEKYPDILKKAFPPEGKCDLTNENDLKKFEEAFKKDPALRKELFDAALANDAKTGGKDAEFFATQFRDLGIIDHAEFRDLFKNDSEKSGPGTEKSPVSGRTALAENFSSAGDGRTYFALDRTGSDGRQFDEFVRVSPDGKSASKEIVGKYGYSITLEPLPLQTAKSAERESKAGELASAESGKVKIENQAKFVQETFGTNGSKIPPPEDPRYEEFKKTIDKIAKETGTPPDPNDPKKTLELIKSSLKSSYAQAIEKTSKTKYELSLLEKSSENTADTEAALREEQARNAIDLLDKTGISALGPKATESLLKKFGAPGCENGKPANLEKFLGGIRPLAGEFRTFVTRTLEKTESSLFDLSADPATLKTIESSLASEFKKLGFLRDDGSLDVPSIGRTQETQTV